MWYPGHIKKAKGKIKTYLKTVQGILELVDARAPYASRAYEYDDLFKNKERIILFNKIDIADESKLKFWEKYYRDKGYKVLKTALKKVSVRSFLTKIVYKSFPKKFSELRVMVAGIPNVGKSTLINSIKGKKALRVGNTPGITRGLQWISVNNQFMLLDTPGILYSEIYNKKILYKLILIGSIKPEEDEKEFAIEYGFNFFKEKYPDIIKKALKSDSIPEDHIKFLELFAKRRNFIATGNTYDIERAMSTFLKELSDGKYGKVVYDYPEDYDILK
ncbi:MULTISPECIES: ribosome biogenesis GTPase YlqF [Marinitoga]|uniref:Ribosome biogenesis GTPase A n=1 Tax=Marinitoga hydrogenitolerans (strain DSM 16785 / JCM 12826 / AT1271) TaxID=1122195 RepID=A0A1M4YEP9_MARH1|nr:MULTISPECIES: ribosome biogenesis GTPase YlqF [Marinitoga]KLO24264.1 GTP-binding protein [Marinitoga sp. 1155]NUV00508.1 GTP-binding protein [Marinitoga sp. 1154]SHF04220.1 ribosome biogenesis GTPase A [Marinitoga hydrogenitolerans DSM 16785]